MIKSIETKFVNVLNVQVVNVVSVCSFRFVSFNVIFVNKTFAFDFRESWTIIGKTNKN